MLLYHVKLAKPKFSFSIVLRFLPFPQKNKTPPLYHLPRSYKLYSNATNQPAGSNYPGKSPNHPNKSLKIEFFFHPPIILYPFNRHIQNILP